MHIILQFSMFAKSQHNNTVLLLLLILSFSFNCYIAAVVRKPVLLMFTLWGGGMYAHVIKHIYAFLAAAVL